MNDELRVRWALVALLRKTLSGSLSLSARLFVN